MKCNPVLPCKSQALSEIVEKLNKIADNVGQNNETLEDHETRFNELVSDLSAAVRDLEDQLYTPVVEMTGNDLTIKGLTAQPVKGVKAVILPTQTGEGDPSPSNIRPIVGVNTVAVTNHTTGSMVSEELPETVYDGTLDWGTGVLTVRRVKRKIKDLYWEVYTNVTGGYRYEAAVTNKAAEVKGILCDTMPVVSYYVENKAETISEREEKVKTLRIITAYATKAEMLAAYGEAEVVYYLADPYTIQLTPQQLQSVKGENHITGTNCAAAVTFAPDLETFVEWKLSSMAATIPETMDDPYAMPAMTMEV